MIRSIGAAGVIQQAARHAHTSPCHASTIRVSHCDRARDLAKHDPQAPDKRNPQRWEAALKTLYEGTFVLVKV